MLIVCPNCATSYGVEMASLRPAGGRTRWVRCCRCRRIWQVELSYADKLLVAAEAMPPVRRAMLAAAQVAADAARSTLPRLRRPTTILAEELEAGRIPGNATPARSVGFRSVSAGLDLARAAVTRLIAGISAVVARAIRRRIWVRTQSSGQPWYQGYKSWPLSWRRHWRQRRRSSQQSWSRSWWQWRQSWYRRRQSWHHRSWRQFWQRSWRDSGRLAWSLSDWRSCRLSLSQPQCVILGLALADAAVIGWGPERGGARA